jgi:hypothetical protein
MLNLIAFVLFISPPSILLQEGFDSPRRSTYPNVSYYSFIRTSDMVMLTIDVYDAQTREDADFNIRAMKPSNASIAVEDRTLSRLPIVARVAGVYGIQSWSQKLRLGDWIVTTQANVNRPEKRTPESDAILKELVEGVGRHFAAGRLAEGMRDPGERRVGHRTLTRLLRGSDGRDLVDIDEYARAFGLPLRRNARLGTATITLGGREVLLVLCADEAKVGGRWSPIGAPIVQRDEKWYAPLEWLESMR